MSNLRDFKRFLVEENTKNFLWKLPLILMKLAGPDEIELKDSLECVQKEIRKISSAPKAEKLSSVFDFSKKRS